MHPTPAAAFRSLASVPARAALEPPARGDEIRGPRRRRPHEDLQARVEGDTMTGSVRFAGTPSPFTGRRR